MYIIFSFSSQTGTQSGSLSYVISHGIVEAGDSLFGKHLSDKEIDDLAEKIQYPVRKCAHMTEYFILALCVSFPLFVYGCRKNKLLILTAVFCVVFACTDEYHQSFVDGRGPAVKDVGIDSIGVLAAVVLIYLAGCYRRRKRELTQLSCKLRADENVLEGGTDED